MVLNCPMQEPVSRSRIIQSAQVEWQNLTPVSHAFDDVYFSRDCGIDETQYVFLQQNGLHERWKDDTLTSFTIAETGFGTGLNFFCAADFWQQQKQQGALSAEAHLHFVSVEKYPLSRKDMEQAGDQWPQFQWITRHLLEQYPALTRGFHRLHFFDANITLTLILDDAITGFSELDGVVDAWFLDGFAPAKNPGMWQPELFEQISRLSHFHTTVATFTAAGIVRRGLQEVGFTIEKVPGFGRKRDMLRGQMQSETAQVELPPDAKPWFRFNYRRHRQPKGKAAIVGAGLAGATVANSLARRGWQVTVFEKEAVIANQGSGNPTGITFTKLSLHDTPQNRFYQWAYLYACRYLLNTLTQNDVAKGLDWNLNGVLRLAYDKKEAAEQAALLAEPYWPAELMEGLSAEQIEHQLGIKTPFNGMLLRGGGWINPNALCAALLKHSNIDLQTGREITSLNRWNERWYLDDDGPFDNGPFDAVILTSAFGVNQFEQARHLPLKAVRGQITYCPATVTSDTLQYAVNYQGYINPARHGYHCVGATFNPKIDTPQERPQDHQWNLDQLHNALPELAEALTPPAEAVTRGRVGFRCQTPDYLPVVGPLPDVDWYREAYHDLSKGFLKRTFPYGNHLDGLLVSCGHGSRGITSSCFSAEIIASYLTGEPQPLDRETLFAIHPARFLIRNIIRRQQ
ncbi:MAG: bifunctional tRNA (5-methylaminomethyl-2-thiouridine)(34)-methyltransferase MnmD/FAD-dependent 5-carboxymethylaminomethyl-2-thiouridine(34) oxidoreductase MnmC [Ketobacter sp.]|nr:MAG: bifunctional tRNA (5-methylaminomethyl-2-thiouridine)(34)-methyltransferase MnmD/FAD-dependent 5-carboxymethylaminomethyl-2-thiouridine(34) oxidoreductase MnmC [Ketobacter sp.]